MFSIPPHAANGFTSAGDVVVANRRADRIVEGDVIMLPELVYLPQRAAGDGHPRWAWQEWPSTRLPNAHAWRWVYDVDKLAADPEGIRACVSLGFVLVRVSDDQPNQGGEHSDLTLCLRGLDLVAVQVERAAAGDARDARPDHRPDSGAT